MNVDSSNNITQYDPKLINPEEYKGIDCIVRLISSSDADELKIKAITSTSTFAKIFILIKEERDIFIKTIKWQKHLLDYNSHYTSFLLGTISEKEFLKISKDYIIKHENCTDIKHLSSDIFILINATKLPFLTQELANIFQCKEDNVLEAMNLII